MRKEIIYNEAIRNERYEQATDPHMLFELIIQDYPDDNELQVELIAERVWEHLLNNGRVEICE